MQVRFDCLKNICKKEQGQQQGTKPCETPAEEAVRGNNLMDSLQLISMDNVFTFLQQWESGNKAINRSWWERNESAGLTSMFS